MAILRKKFWVKNTAGEWDNVHYETDSEQVIHEGIKLNVYLEAIKKFMEGIKEKSILVQNISGVSYTSRKVTMRKFGPIVFCEVRISATTAAKNHNYESVFEIPEGYRPIWNDTEFMNFSTPSISSNEMDGYETIYKVYGSGKVDMITGHTGLTERFALMTWLTNE